jgi:hypothetical protein
LSSPSAASARARCSFSADMSACTIASKAAASPATSAVISAIVQPDQWGAKYAV